VVVSSEAGLFRRSADFTSPVRKLRVWPELAWNRPSIQFVGKTVCQLGGHLFAGKPYPQGLKGHIVVVIPDESGGLGIDFKFSGGKKFENFGVTTSVVKRSF